MQNIKVEGRLDNNSRSRMIHRLITVNFILLFILVASYGVNGYLNYKINSDEYVNAQATIEQLAEQYGYVDESSLTVDELMQFGSDVDEYVLQRIYLDRQELSTEDFLTYTEIRDYCTDITEIVGLLQILGIGIVVFMLLYLVYILE